MNLAGCGAGVGCGRRAWRQTNPREEQLAAERQPLRRIAPRGIVYLDHCPCGGLRRWARKGVERACWAICCWVRFKCFRHHSGGVSWAGLAIGSAGGSWLLKRVRPVTGAGVVSGSAGAGHRLDLGVQQQVLPSGAMMFCRRAIHGICTCWTCNVWLVAILPVDSVVGASVSAGLRRGGRRIARIRGRTAGAVYVRRTRCGIGWALCL